MRAKRGDDGAAAVEFALISVLLLTLLFGILQYGYYFYQLSSANAASREAARLAATGVSDCDKYKQAVLDRTSGISIVKADITTTVTTAPAASPQDGDRVNVTITFRPTKFGFPFVPFISGTTQSEVGKARIESPGSVIACP